MKRLVFILMLLAAPLMAVEPDEILDDPVLETRAREISKGLRCLVCQNESIDESHASLARDLRILVRERLVAGDSDTQTVDFIVERYGEYVLLQPRVTGANWLLWGAGPLMLLIAGATGLVYIRGRARAVTPQDDRLSDDEAARLAKILEE
ncbi:cytochrome c-type biogenesis protein CcmH [Pseudosulfitobacter sp. SM2401]|uniref:cytochrome c-type biogenesis protein n=1 Tax=Pseudosulfitobacter sp. SM2401 TaxID=3350098 RepID=UPI0036F1F047